MDPLLMEGKIRADPEMHRRITVAQAQFDVRYRIDKPYRKVTVSWTELVHYTRADGKYEAERPVGQTATLAPKLPPQPGSHLVSRTRIESMPPGAYRIKLEGETQAGELTKIDERTFWFDGKSFEEL
jgi:hypothetical protein